MPKVVDHDAYRRELLSRCLELFSRKDYGSLTMREIAENLAVSTGTLYHYFPSKESLFAQLLEQVTGEHIEKAKGEISQGKTIRERLERLFAHCHTHKAECQQEKLIFLNYLLSQDAEAARTPYIQARERYCQAGREILHIDRPEILTLLLCLLDGMILESIYDPNLDYKTIGAVFAEMVAVYMEYKAIEEEF
jgi:AcrR family transcriptional regulator